MRNLWENKWQQNNNNKSNMNKLFLTLLTALCCTTMANAENQYAKCIDNIYYILNSSDKTAGVTWGKSQEHATDEYTGDIHIPDSINYGGVTYYVTYIGDNAFYDCTGLNSITYSDNLQSIGAYAFKGCTGLRSIKLPKDMEVIRVNTFEGCTGLTSITLPEKLKSIFVEAFKGCTNLTSIAIPINVTSIGNNAFNGTTNMKEVFVYSESLTNVGTAVWSNTIPTYVKATSFKTYKANVFKAYNIKVLPDDGSIGDAIKGEFNFSDEEAEVINKLLSIRSTLGKKQSGAAAEVTKGNQSITLYAPDNVKFIKEEE